MSANDIKVGSLAEESLKRKQRLEKLKNAANNAEKSERKVVFRSYKPQDASINDAAIKQGPSGEIEKEVQSQMDLLKTSMITDEIDIVNLAPRKPDWDLKRDVTKKLQKLERRTQKAIAELIRDRLAKSQDISKLVNTEPAFEEQNKR